MRYAIAFVVGLVVAGAWPSAAAAEGDAAPTTGETAPAAEVLAAPGGGEMVILGPASRYVTRAWRDGAGQLHAGCAREPGAATERAGYREQR